MKKQTLVPPPVPAGAEQGPAAEGEDSHRTGLREQGATRCSSAGCKREGHHKGQEGRLSPSQVGEAPAFATCLLPRSCPRAD